MIRNFLSFPPPFGSGSLLYSASLAAARSLLCGRLLAGQRGAGGGLLGGHGRPGRDQRYGAVLRVLQHRAGRDLGGVAGLDRTLLRGLEADSIDSSAVSANSAA